MNITIVGTGYVGLVTGACFSEMGNKVYSIDIDGEKIEGLKKEIMPIYEHDLEDMCVKSYEKGNIIFTTNLEKRLSDSEICFIAAGTPMDEDSSADLSAIFQIAKNIGQLMNNYLIIVNKSTVPVGTGDKVREIISKELANRNASFNFDVVSNPEFLKERVCIKDDMRPDRVVIGPSNKNSIKVMKELYSPYVVTMIDLLLWILGVLKCLNMHLMRG